MRILLAQLSPVPGDFERNTARLEEAVRAAPCDLAIFPELFLSGYRIGDRFHRLALRPGDERLSRLRGLARTSRATVVVGTPVTSVERSGEVHNAALAVPPEGEPSFQAKRYLPTFGPFEEGVQFTPADRSHPVRISGSSVGLEICYDAFFPEVSRDLALGGAEILVNISAAPVTSRRLFEKVLAARAVENAMPVVYVNRVGVEDGVVFGGGSGAWDPRGEPIPTEHVSFAPAEPEEGLALVEIDLSEAAHWRPFRPVLRDLAGRSGTSEPGPTTSRAHSIPTRPL
jgi:predicted amidohydrolase